MPHRIIVCGIFRSGTSLITKLACEWGAYAGKEKDLFQDETCYLEHIVLQKFNNDLINNNSSIPTPIDMLREKAKDPVFQQSAWKMMETMDQEAQAANAIAWVWKDPNISLTIPFWADFWKDAIYIIPVRHPVETILSLAKLEGIEVDQAPFSAGLIYWQYCVLNILNFTQNNQRKIFISYDQLIQNPEQECQRLCTFLDEQCEASQGTKFERVQKMILQIKRDQRHYQASASIADLETASAEQRALYNFLRVKTMYPNENFNPNDFALYPGWLEYLQVMNIVVSSMKGSS